MQSHSQGGASADLGTPEQQGVVVDWGRVSLEEESQCRALRSEHQGGHGAVSLGTDVPPGLAVSPPAEGHARAQCFCSEASTALPEMK